MAEAPRNTYELDAYARPDYARSYDERWSGTKRARDERKRAALVAALRVLGPWGEGATLLDAPCGTGRFAELLPAEGFRYTGADRAAAMVEVARAKHPGRHFEVADLALLPWGDASFDAAVCIRLFHLVHERATRQAYLRELARVARHGVVVDYRQRESLRGASSALRHALGLRAAPPEHLRRAEFAAELEEAGLRPAAWIPVRRPGWTTDKVVVACRVKRT